jgi:arylsulfatase A-like enzyme
MTMAKKPFKGVVKLDVRDSKPDWDPYIPTKAPAGAPNILFVLYDDTGMAAWSPFGGRINMPTLQKLADKGLMYSQWHTTALCSPTRSTLLTGRNHHLNGSACISEAATGYPGANGHIPDECATVGQILQDGGWSTFWLGKHHNLPETDTAAGANRHGWPMQKGFDRFYGFFGGETNQWYPDLVEDNHAIDQPYWPEQGYHLSKDMARSGLADDQGSEGRQPVEAVVHVVLPRRQPCATPRAEGVHRQVQGQVRRRL